MSTTILHISGPSMGVEVYSIEELGGKLVTDEGALTFLMPLDMPFTATSVELAKTQLLEGGDFGDVTITYDGEFNGLVVCFSDYISDESVRQALDLKSSLRADQGPEGSTIEVLALDCSRGFPELVIEPTQVLTAAMINDIIDRFDGKLAGRRDDWSGSTGWGTFTLEHMDDEYYADSDDPEDEEAKEGIIGYADMALRVVAKYLYSGMIWAMCEYDSDDRLEAIHHTVRVISPVTPDRFNIEKVQRMVGVARVEVDEFQQVHVWTNGPELLAFSDPRQFITAVHGMGAEIAKTLNIFPIVAKPYSITLERGTNIFPATLERRFDVTSDRPVG